MERVGQSRWQSKQGQALELRGWAARAAVNGELTDIITRAREALVAVELGHTLQELFGDGTLGGWNFRMALSHCAGQPASNWDGEPGRTQLERWALVARVLLEAGADAPTLAQVASRRRAMHPEERTARLAALVGELGGAAERLEALLAVQLDAEAAR